MDLKKVISESKGVRVSVKVEVAFVGNYDSDSVFLRFEQQKQHLPLNTEEIRVALLTQLRESRDHIGGELAGVKKIVGEEGVVDRETL